MSKYPAKWHAIGPAHCTTHTKSNHATYFHAKYPAVEETFFAAINVPHRTTFQQAVHRAERSAQCQTILTADERAFKSATWSPYGAAFLAAQLLTIRKTLISAFRDPVKSTQRATL